MNQKIAGANKDVNAMTTAPPPTSSTHGSPGIPASPVDMVAHLRRECAYLAFRRPLSRKYYCAETGRDCSSALPRSSHRARATIPLARGSVSRRALIDLEIPRSIAN